MNLFVWDLPLSPDDPFSNPTLIILDSLRVLIGVFAVLSIALIIPSIPMARNMPTRYRLFALLLFSLYVGLTEVQRIGFYANWRLVLGTLCAVFTFMSVLLFVRFEGDRRYAPKWARWGSDQMHTKQDRADRTDREAGADRDDEDDKGA